MTARSARVRALVEEHFAAAVLVAVALFLVGGYLTYATHVAPGEETEQLEGPGWTSTGAFTHQAPVTEDTTVFEQGDVLQDRTSYFTQIAPVLGGSFSYGYELDPGPGTAGETDLGAAADLTLVVRSVADGTELWRFEEPLAAESAESLAPGETLTVPFAVNVTELRTRISDIREELGASPGETEVRVVSQLSLTGTRIGEPVDRTQTYELGLDPGESVYRVTADDPVTDSASRTVERTVTATYGPVRSVGAPLLLIGGLVALSGLAAGARRDEFEVSAVTRDRMEYQAVAGEFGEWLTRGEIPEAAMDRPRVPVESLEGLVDVAVDSNSRVIEDRDRGYCAVLGDDVTYLYEIPAAVTDSGEDRAGSPTDDPLESADAPAGGEPLLARLKGTIGGEDSDASDRQNGSDSADTDPDETAEADDSEPARSRKIDDDRSG